MNNQDIYLTKTLSAPSGVTNVAGANAYAAKFAISPIPTENKMHNKTKKLEFCGIHKII